MKSLFLPLAFLLAGTCAAADTPARITIDHAYSHPTAAPGVPGVGFVTLTNVGKKADRLLSAESSAAGRIEIHRTQVKDGVMQMRAVAEGVALPSGKPVAFAPGGLHLMLFDLREPLRDGGQVPLTLIFEQAGRVTTALQVKPRENLPAEDHRQHQHH